jgi:hypothetical protein
VKDEANLLRSNGTFIEKAVESDGSGGRAEGPYCVYALELHCSGSVMLYACLVGQVKVVGAIHQPIH